mgnify:CR=1 FL=1
MTTYDKNLGKRSEYISQYQPELLDPIPRKIGRDEIKDLKVANYAGYDLWTAFEVSWLNNKGKPIVAIAEFMVPHTSDNLIESKSFKLYLNSFNQTRFSSWDQVEQTLIKDLSACAGETVSVTVRSVVDYTDSVVVTMDGDCIDEQEIEITSYDFDRTLIQGAATGEVVEESLHSHVLKSNCLITNQPDWGSVEIQYKGKQIDREALLRYLVSFREHNEFHEQCVERIFTDIMEFCQPESLTVYARYTRRGGLDINPYRSNVTSQPSHNQRMARQ